MRKSAALLCCITLFASVCSANNEYRWHRECLKCGSATVGRTNAGFPDGIYASHTSERLDDGIFKLCWKFTAERDMQDVRITVDFIQNEQASYWMIPAISYDGNHWGKGLEPKGAAVDGMWYTYSYRRTPVPGAIYSEGAEYAVATWSDVPRLPIQDFSCSIMPEESTVTHRLIWPEEEMPASYCNRDRYAPGWQRNACLAKGESVEITQYICVSRVDKAHSAQHRFMDFCWRNMPHPTPSLPDAKSIWELGIRYFKETLWSEEGVFKGFNIGLLPDEDKGWYKRTAGKYESGWCGQNISIACSLLQDYLDNGSHESLEKGIATLDTWAYNCPLPNGLFICRFDQILNGTEATIDACNLGTTAVNLLEAYNLAAECGYDRPLYRDAALQICNFAAADQRADGCYARGWKPSGECIYREGTVGCFLVPAMLEAYKASRDVKYYESALKAYDFYVSELRENGFTTAGALDTWCIDKESAISLLRSSMRLYKATGETQYLDDALQTSYYLSTWLWHYDGVYPQDDSFTVNGYHTFGATAVSVQHHHLDFYATLWIPEWIELSALTGDSQWREKARAIWSNSTQLISDGNLTVNGRLRPAGSQNEAYFECVWGFGVESAVSDPATAAAMQHVKAPSASRTDRVNNWLVAWPGAFRLETLRRLERSCGWKVLE